jgi:microcystin-dependent protein
MATVTASYNWVSGETVTPAKLNTTAAPTVVVADNEVTTAKIADGNVTLAKLVTAVQQALLPAGAVQAFAMNSAPAGWLAADGTAVSRSTYAALFAAISTTYGAGDGSTTFALPDLRGIFVRGSGSQAISGITYNKTFAAKEGDAFQGHQHAVTHDAIRLSGPAHTLAGGFGAEILSASIQIGNPTTDGSNGTPRTASETRPANIALFYCIKF